MSGALGSAMLTMLLLSQGPDTESRALLDAIVAVDYAPTEATVKESAAMAEAMILGLAAAMEAAVEDRDHLRELALHARLLHDRVRWIGQNAPATLAPETLSAFDQALRRSRSLALATYFDGENVGAGALRFLAWEGFAAVVGGDAGAFEDAQRRFTDALALTSPVHRAQPGVRAMLHLERGELRARFPGSGPERLRWLDRAIEDVRLALRLGVPGISMAEYARAAYGAATDALFEHLEAEGDGAGALSRIPTLTDAGFDWSGKERSWLRAARLVSTTDVDRAAELYERAVHLVANRVALGYGELTETFADRIAARDVALTDARWSLEVIMRTRGRTEWFVEVAGVILPSDPEGCSVLEEAVDGLEALGRTTASGSLRRRVLDTLCKSQGRPEPPPEGGRP